MCGRFYVEIDNDELQEIFKEVQRNTSGTEQLSFSMSSIEIFPTNIVPIRISEKEYKPMKWGFTGFGGKPIINARSETALMKPTFKQPMQTGRCLIPASGYYEWQRNEKFKQKYSFSLPDKKTMYMAGCYRLEESNPFPCFVVLTHDASDGIKHIHDRMPVIIPENNIYDWLHTGADPMQYAVDEVISCIA